MLVLTFFCGGSSINICNNSCSNCDDDDTDADESTRMSQIKNGGLDQYGKV